MRLPAAPPSAPRRAPVVATGLVAVLVALSALLSGCAGDDVATSTLPAAEVRLPPGPTYLTQGPGPVPSWRAVVGGRAVSLGRISDPHWLPDGRLLVEHRTYERSGPDLGTTGQTERLVDPADGTVVREVPGSSLGDWDVTPEAITLRGEDRLVVYTPDLTRPAVVAIDASAVATDQLGDEGAELSLSGAAPTLGGVTWVQWGVDSEDDTLTDHGVLRVEDGEPVEVLRDEPVVSLVASSDGAALLALVQDDGEDEDCGGCLVEQTLVELDPATGEVAADLGMPEGYDRSWRVEALDEIGEQVVARFVIGNPETGLDTTQTRQTWVHDDGGWRHLDDLDGTRTTYQDGGRLVWTPLQTGRDADLGAAFRLEWVPDDGPVEVLVDGGADCPRRDGDRGPVQCPFVDAPGSLLPPG